ncbi:MAG: molybdopterin-synthase adenylyltransferase MoeB [Gammaproteobacteria bacterium]
MKPEAKEKYARQIRLDEIGEAGQRRLLDARVLIVGLGGLGSPVALYLSAAGIGHLLLSDFDQVDLSNLQRQIIHRPKTIGRLKVDSAAACLADLNPDTHLTTFARGLDEEELMTQVARVDVIVDCSDNFSTRFLLNRIAVQTQTPLVSGAAIRWEGQISTFAFDENCPCYRCLYEDDGSEGDNCEMEGVIAPLVGVIGSLQAQEVINVLLGKSALAGRLLLFDAQRIEWREMRLKKAKDCPVCG